MKAMSSLQDREASHVAHCALDKVFEGSPISHVAGGHGCMSQTPRARTWRAFLEEGTTDQHGREHRTQTPGDAPQPLPPTDSREAIMLR
ncbi:hypothetical protein FLM9_1076 [Candidatus Synechococcus spongiarum]|uniref:Uncharacterized protein n=1 Tax=Candidatus Synechococcus spongiarum TaxID=431041 RepID=A0A171DGZ0_9SYNE|nr:hypothetical protein FLM9_1076 [Candidatus Synechococcus spongiarum]